VIRESVVNAPLIFTCDSVLHRIPFVLDIDKFTLEHQVFLHGSSVEVCPL
jgi:hypothetical protein